MKKQNDLPEIVVLKEGFLYLNVCVAIPPERMQEIPDKVYLLLGSPGTSHGRWELVDLEKHPDLSPVECLDYEGRWHYVLYC